MSHYFEQLTILYYWILLALLHKTIYCIKAGQALYSLPNQYFHERLKMFYLFCNFVFLFLMLNHKVIIDMRLLFVCYTLWFFFFGSSLSLYCLQGISRFKFKHIFYTIVLHEFVSWFQKDFFPLESLQTFFHHWKSLTDWKVSLCNPFVYQAVKWYFYWQFQYIFMNILGKLI